MSIRIVKKLINIGQVRSLKTSQLNKARPVKVPPQLNESTFPFYDPWFNESPRGPQPRTKSGSKYTVSMIPGEGIGKEMIEATLEVLGCCGAPIVPEWLSDDHSVDALDRMKMSVMRNGVAITGNIEHRSMMEIVSHNSDPRNFLLREALDLFVNVTPLKSFCGLDKNMRINKDIDVIMIRSNNEGEYSLLEHQPCEGVCEHLRVITKYNSRRVAEFAFKLAEQTNRKKVTVVHQKNIMPLSEGLFVSEFLNVAKKYPGIENQVVNPHNAIDSIMKGKSSFDIILSNSIYCSQLVRIFTGMIGGPTLVSCGSHNDRYAVFYPRTNSRSRNLVGKDVANPTSYLLCGSYVLNYLGFSKLGTILRNSIETAFMEGIRTKDLGGTASTTEFVARIIKQIRTEVPRVICKYDNPPKIVPKLPKQWKPDQMKPIHK